MTKQRSAPRQNVFAITVRDGRLFQALLLDISAKMRLRFRQATGYGNENEVIESAKETHLVIGHESNACPRPRTAESKIHFSSTALSDCC